MSAQAMAASPFGANVDPGRALQRALSWSFGVHVGVILILLVVPHSWFEKRTAHPTYMTISLGASAGPRSTGMTPIGGRTVEQVAPPPTRTEPARPKDQQPSPTPVKALPQQPVANTVQAMRPPPTRAPVTGPQAVVGNTVVDTGARGLGAGLTFGGGGGATGEIKLDNFCCPEYLETLTQQIASHWNKDQPVAGIATLKFTIQRDGRITNITLETSSGNSYLDRASRNALEDTRQLPPLPIAFTLPTLIIHLKFPYNGPQ
jgi:TonB family protein